MTNEDMLKLAAGEPMSFQASSQVVAGATYYPKTDTLQVYLTSGSVYMYSGVSFAEYDAFRNAPSKGQYYNAVIKSHPYS